MTRSRRILSASAALCLAAPLALLLHSAPPRTSAVDAAKSQRSFAFTYQVHVPADAGAKSAHLWIPLPQDDAYQSVTHLKIESLVSHTDGHDPEYHNPFAVFTPTAAQAAAGYDVTLVFDATRHEHVVDINSPAMQKAAEHFRGQRPAHEALSRARQTRSPQRHHRRARQTADRRRYHSARKGPPHL